jgi:hypothetical protein
MRASHAAGIILIVIGVVGLAASVGGYGLAATLPWLVAIALIGAGLAAILAAVAGVPAETGPFAGLPPKTQPAQPLSSSAPPAMPGFGGPAGPGAAPAWGAAPPATYRKGFGDIEMAGPLNLGPTRYETFLGEIRLDLGGAQLLEGETPIWASTVLGGIKILTPPDVGVAVRAQTVLGCTEVLGRPGGTFATNEIAVSHDYATAARRVRIEARIVLGDVAVRRARSMPRPSFPAPPAASPAAGLPSAPSPTPPGTTSSTAEPPSA